MPHPADSPDRTPPAAPDPGRPASVPAAPPASRRQPGGRTADAAVAAPGEREVPTAAPRADAPPHEPPSDVAPADAARADDERRVERLARAALAIARRRSVEEVLAEITEQARALIGTHQAVTSLTVDAPGAAGGSAPGAHGIAWAQAITAVSLSDRYAAWRGYGHEPGAQPDGSGIYRLVCETNEPIRLTQAALEAHPAWHGFGAQRDRHPPMRGWLAAPLVGRDGRNIGLVQLSDREDGGEFTATDEATLVQLAHLGAAFAENARLVDAERAAREAAERAAAAKSDFLAAMSHEIRTPINAQLGYAELLDLELAGPLTAAQRDYVARLTASSRHLLGLVNDVLDLAKVEAGELAVSRDAALTGAAVAAALDLVRPQAEEKGVRLVDEGAGDDGEPFVGDEHRVRQILVNLLSNAVKFTAGPGLVTVRCATVAEAPPSAHLHGTGPWAALTVRDSGAGIAPEAHARIFDPFYQARGDEGTVYTRKVAGTGLGLAISRRLARLMDGDLTLDRSAPGEGSAFTLWLPASAAGESAAARAGRAGDAPEADARAAETAHAVTPERRGPPILRVPRLDVLGTALRTAGDAIVGAYAARLCEDPVTAPAARALTRAQLEDHQVTYVADLSQSFVIVGDPSTTAPLAASLLADGSAIQRTVAEHHGRRRHAQGWSEAAVDRDQRLLGEEIERVVHEALARAGDAHAPPADEALAVLRQLLARGRALSVAGWRQAALSTPP